MLCLWGCLILYHNLVIIWSICDVCVCVFVVRAAVEHVDEAIDCGDALALLSALQNPSLGLRGLLRDHSDWYLEQLTSDREQKALVRRIALHYIFFTFVCNAWGECHLRCKSLFVCTLSSRIWGVWTLWREMSCRKVSVWPTRKLSAHEQVSSSPALRLNS